MYRVAQKKGAWGDFKKSQEDTFISICTLKDNRFSVVHVNFQTISSICQEIGGIFLKSSIFGVNMNSKQIKSIKWKTKAKGDPSYSF